MKLPQDPAPASFGPTLGLLCKPSPPLPKASELPLPPRPAQGPKPEVRLSGNRPASCCPSAHRPQRSQVCNSRATWGSAGGMARKAHFLPRPSSLLQHRPLHHGYAPHQTHPLNCIPNEGKGLPRGHPQVRVELELLLPPSPEQPACPGTQVPRRPLMGKRPNTEWSLPPWSLLTRSGEMAQDRR